MAIATYWNTLKNLLPAPPEETDSLGPCLKDLENLLGQDFAKVIFDVGAYDGTVSKYLGEKFEDSTIHAFEPFPNAYAQLLYVASTCQNLRTYPVALSSAPGTEKLFVNHFNETNSLFQSRKLNSSIDQLTCNVADINIETTSLDYFCSQQGISQIDFLKLDVQGAELKVLQGGSHLLQNKGVAAIYCEVEFVEIYEGQPLFDQIFAYLKQHHYSFYKFYNLNTLETGQLAWADALFISEHLFHSHSIKR